MKCDASGISDLAQQQVLNPIEEFPCVLRLLRDPLRVLIQVPENRVTPQGVFYKDLPHFVNADGNYLFCRYWEPKTPPRALALILHGTAEHSGRYMEVAKMLVNQSLFVFTHDHIGHGQSEGKRMAVSGFKVYVRDCLQHFDMMTKSHPGLKVFILAHSMGGTMAIYVANARKADINGVIFIAPLLLLNPESTTPVKKCIAKLMYHLLPNITLGYMDARWLSRSEREVKNFENDPLCYHGPYKMRFIVEVLNAVSKLEKVFPNITWPMLILHGDDDKLCDIRGSYLMYRNASSTDKTLKVCKDCYHQLHKELPNVVVEVFTVIVKWINDRLPPTEQ
uniref:monoglyceride lipase-like n=1 Tax=Pristiophorus japonicus TaxID=55135 RepID=UPI00398F02CC